MIIYSLLCFTLLFALCSLAFAWRCHRHNMPLLSLAISSAVFIHLYGAWILLSVYAKYVFDISFIAVIVYALIRNDQKIAIAGKLKRVLSLVFTGLFAVLSVFYFEGTTGKLHTGVADLRLPFRSGSYFVFQGGKGLPTNVFHYKLRGAVFAMDLVKLNAYGNRAKHIFSTKLDNYEIYGDTLCSPCDARVAMVNDGNPDNTPPDRKRGPTNTNFILLETESMYVFMAHLKPGSMLVKNGDRVRVGQPLAQCGNSGFSIEPHLHIQAHTKTGTGLPWYHEKPLMIKFSGTFYNLFETIEAR